MKPPKVDSNAYSYHLKALQKDGLVEKQPKGYRLSPAGLFYVDKVSMENLESRLQPKIITMLVAENEAGEVLLYSKLRQPFITAWTLPFGKVHLEDASVTEAMQREALEKAGIEHVEPEHKGDCYIKVDIAGQVVSYVLAHVFYAQVGRSRVDTEKHLVEWLNDGQRSERTLGPAVEDIITSAKSDAAFWFRSYVINW